MQEAEMHLPSYQYLYNKLSLQPFPFHLQTASKSWQSVLQQKNYKVKKHLTICPYFFSYS